MTKAMTSNAFIKDNMLIDPSIQQDIIRRAVDGNLGDNPSQAVHSLGTVKTPDGRDVAVHVRHAADAVLVDDFGHVVLITRRHNPGAGLKALPGGFMDPVPGIGGATVAENSVTAALREATEETGISKQLLEGAHILPVGHRSYESTLRHSRGVGRHTGHRYQERRFLRRLDPSLLRENTTRFIARVSASGRAGPDKP